MKGLMRVLVVAAIAAFVLSSVNEVWRATTFDSELAGLVHRSYGTDPGLAAQIVQLAAAKGITLTPDSPRIAPSGARSEVTVRYAVPLGLGSLSVRWERSVSAFTEGASPYGVPLSEGQTPSTPPPGSGMMGLPSRVGKSLQGAQGR